MKKTILLITAVGFMLTTAEAKKKEVVVKPVVVFANAVDSMSYALGLNVGADFKKNIEKIPGGKSNIELLVKGFSTAMKGDSALMSDKVAAEFFKAYISKAQAKDLEVKKGAGEKFLADNKTKPGVMTTPSGLQYQVIVAKEGPKPAATDSVKVHYTGTLIDGTKFDSSVDRGEPITFPLNQVIPGWTEGVQLMSVGSKYKFFVPYNLGYGEQGTQGGPIPGYSTLIFDVELIDIKPLKVAAPVVEVKEAEPAKAVKGKSTAKKGKK